MASTYQHFAASGGSRNDAPVLETTAQWLNEEDDSMLGCESANPALQIERWRHEAPLAGAYAA